MKTEEMRAGFEKHILDQYSYMKAVVFWESGEYPWVNHGDGKFNVIDEWTAYQAATAAERERCAVVAESFEVPCRRDTFEKDTYQGETAREIAKAIQEG